MASRYTGAIIEKKRSTKRRTLTAAANLANTLVGAIYGGLLVTINGTDRTAAVCTAATVPYGVQIHDSTINKPVTVFLDGELPMIASGAITAGNLVVAAAGGAVSAAGATPDGRFVVGRATTNAANGAIVYVEVNL